VIRLIFLLITAVIVAGTGCAANQKNKPSLLSEKYNIEVPPMEFVGPFAEKLWEGIIDKRPVSYFRTPEEEGDGYVIVVVRNELPLFYKRTEYLDGEGDGILDQVSMKIYEEGPGWRRVGITREHKYGIEYAGSIYKALREKIEELRSNEKK